MFNRLLRAVQRGHPTEFHAPYISFGLVFTEMGQYQKAEESFVKKIQVVRREKGEHGHASIARRFLAGVHRLQGRYEEAERGYIELLDRVDPNDRDALKLTDGLADVYRDQGRYREAEQLYKTVLEKRRHIWGPQAAAPTVGSLARLYTDRGDYDQADEMFRQAREIIAEREKPWMPTWYTYNLGVLRTKQGRLEEAETLFEEARDRWRRQLAEIADDHPEMLKVINGLGVLRREQRHYEEAESLLRQALEGRQRKLGPKHPACFESKHELALVYVAREDYDKAELLLLDAFHSRETKLGPNHPHTIASLRELVNLYESWPRPDEAAKWRAKLSQRGDAENGTYPPDEVHSRAAGQQDAMHGWRANAVCETDGSVLTQAESSA